MALSEALKCAASVIENAPLRAGMYGTGVGTSTYLSRSDRIAVVVKSLHWNLELKPGFVRPHTR
jgi:hypothetical protein